MPTELYIEEGLRLRPFSEADAPVLAKLANNAKIAQFMMNRFPHPYQLSDAYHFIMNVAMKSGQQIWAIEKDGQLVGAAGIHPKEDVNQVVAELGYWVAEEFWKQGIASKAVVRLIDHAWEEYPILQRIEARIYEKNVASQALATKLGFEREARLKRAILKNGELQDLFIFAIWRKK